MGGGTSDKLVIQHHRFKIVMLAVFKMFYLVVWAPAMPRPNTGLVFFLGHLEKLRFFSAWPLLDLPFAHCYLSEGKPFIPSNYFVVPDTTISHSVSLLLCDYETKRQAAFLRKELEN